MVKLITTTTHVTDTKSIYRVASRKPQSTGLGSIKFNNARDASDHFEKVTDLQPA
jgi:hypothetical protein